MTTITLPQIETRRNWVLALENSTATFTETSDLTLNKLEMEVQSLGIESLLSHIRFCGHIPEHYSHDSTAEKAYSKYTDAVVAE